MPELKLNISYSKNEGLVMSPSNLINLYLNGIPLCYPNGGKISDITLRQKLEFAQKEIENFLSIKINRQLWEENHDFIREEFFRYGYIKTVYLINEPEELEGKINNVRQIHYPKGWLSCKRGSDIVQSRNLYIMPNTSDGVTQNQNGFVFQGLGVAIGMFGGQNIPNYWHVKYYTGWCPNEIPADIIDAIGKFAAIQVLAIAGDLIYGAGIGNQSVSLDGISQQYSTTKGGGKGAFAGRVAQYQEELKNQMASLKAEYVGINFRVM